MRKRSIIKLERVVKEVYARDKSCDEMYTSLYNLVSAIISIKNIAFNYTEVDEIAHRLATDIYLKLNDGSGWSINSWTKYLWLRSKDYRDKYIKETRSVELYVEDRVDLEYFLSNNFKSMNRSMNYSAIQRRHEELLNYIPELFNKLINHYIKYTEEHELYRDIVNSIKSTIYARLINSDDSLVCKISLFNYDEIDTNYISVISTIIVTKLYEYLNYSVELDVLEDNMTTLYQIGEFSLKEGAVNV